MDTSSATETITDETIEVPPRTLPHRSLIPVVESLRLLLQKDLPPHQFFQEALHSLVAEDAEALAGIWMASPAQSLTLYVDVGFTANGILEDRRQYQSNQELLLKGWQADQPVVLELNSQDALGQHRCLLLPIRKGEQRIGLVQLISSSLSWDGTPGPELTAASELARLIDQYLQRAEAVSRALDPEKFHLIFSSFTAKLHQSLDPRQVSTIAANETCQNLGCERAWVVERRGSRWQINAVSGQKTVRHTSPQVRAFRNLVQQVAPSARRFVFPTDEADLPQSVVQTLMAYLQESGVQMLVIEPLDVTQSADGLDSSRSKRRPVGVLVCEQFQDHLPAPGLLPHLDVWAEQIALAVMNSRQHQRLLLLPGIKIISRAYDGVSQSRLALTTLLVCAVAALFCGLAICTQDLQIHSRGHLMPVLQRHVYATADGEVAELFVQESEVVAAGQPLLRLRSSDLEFNELTLTSQLQERIQNRDAVRASLRTALTAKERNDSTRLQAQVEALTIEINSIQQRLQLVKDERSKLVVTSPISGTVTTSQPQVRLINRPVQRGESLLEVMDESGPWKLELDIPERRAGHVFQTLREQSTANISFRMIVKPQVVLHGELVSLGDRTAVSEEFGTVVHATCQIDKAQLPLQRIGADVSAQVNCGSRSLLFVYFGEFWEFLYRQWWL